MRRRVLGMLIMPLNTTGRECMSVRFYRRIPIVPGLLYVNLSKGGVSISLGRRGLTFTVGRRGVRATVGLPGTGISVSRDIKRGVADADTGNSEKISSNNFIGKSNVEKK